MKIQIRTTCPSLQITTDAVSIGEQGSPVLYLPIEHLSSYKLPHNKNQQNDCAPSEDLDQPGHPPSPIRVFAVCSMGS